MLSLGGVLTLHFQALLTHPKWPIGASEVGWVAPMQFLHYLKM